MPGNWKISKDKDGVYSVYANDLLQMSDEAFYPTAPDFEVAQAIVAAMNEIPALKAENERLRRINSMNVDGARLEAMTTDREALDPCPFCGHEAEIERIGDARQSTIYACTFCGCRLETGEKWGHGRQWNARTSPEAKEPALTSDAIDAGAQRLASFQDNSVWPDSWPYLDVMLMRRQAENVIRSALVEMGIEFEDRSPGTIAAAIPPTQDPET